MKRVLSLQARLMLSFSLFTLLFAALFGAYAMAFTYSAEDRWFEAQLAQEARAQLRHWHQHGRWTVPREPWVTLHADASTFPDDLLRVHRREPQRREIGGESGRYYHLHTLNAPPSVAPVWLVAEVGEQLVVRPLRDDMLGLLAGSGLVMVLLALTLAWRLSKRIAGPLARLAERVDAMTPDNPATPLAEDFAPEEVGRLARRIDALHARVQAFIAREQEFTRDASHELRTPLAVIRSAAERLQDEAARSPSGQVHVTHMLESARQLEQTVTLLLALARESRPDAHAATVPVLPLIERVIVEQAPLLDDRPVQVQVEVPRTACLNLPASVVRVLLSNLIGNAFAHTHVGRVRIDVDAGRLRIINSGDLPVPPAEWAAGVPYSARDGGSGQGLGLSIVRRLCERFGVDLRLEHSDDGICASIALAPAGSDIEE